MPKTIKIHNRPPSHISHRMICTETENKTIMQRRIRVTTPPKSPVDVGYGGHLLG